MASKNIIVTGATGYIGGTFSYEALKKGFKVIGIDNFCNSSPDNEKKLSEFSNFTFLIAIFLKAKRPLKKLLGRIILMPLFILLDSKLLVILKKNKHSIGRIICFQHLIY